MDLLQCRHPAGAAGLSSQPSGANSYEEIYLGDRLVGNRVQLGLRGRHPRPIQHGLGRIRHDRFELRADRHLGRYDQRWRLCQPG